MAVQDDRIGWVIRAVALLSLVIAASADHLAWLEQTGWQEPQRN